MSLAKDNNCKYLQRNGNAQNDLRILNITYNFDYLILGNRCEPKKPLNQMKNKPLRFFWSFFRKVSVTLSETRHLDFVSFFPNGKWKKLQLKLHFSVNIQEFVQVTISYIVPDDQPI